MKENQLKIGAILSYLAIAVNMIIGFVYTPILTAKLGQSEYGLYSLITSIISYLTILDCGLGNAIIIYTTRYMKKNQGEKVKQLHGMFLAIYTIIGIIASVVGVILYFNVNKLFNTSVTIEEIQIAKKLIAILIINLAITFPGTVFNNIIIANEKFIYLKLVNIITLILKPAIMIPLLYLGANSVVLVTIITLVNSLNIILNIIFCTRKLKVKFEFKRWDKKLLTEIFGFSIWVALQEIVDKVNWNIDNFLLGKFSGTIAVSVYAVASQINQIYISTSTAISGVMLPKITKIAEEKDNKEEKMTDLLIKTGRIQLFIIGLILTGFIIFGKAFINLWVGYEYKQAYYIGCLLMLPMIIPLIQNISGGILQAQNKHKTMSKIYALMALINIIISIPLIKRFEGIGAALGTAISLTIGNGIIKNIYYQKVIKLDIIKFFKQILKTIIILVILSVIGFIIINNYIVINRWITLIIYIGIYALIYLIMMYKLALNDYEKDIIKGFIKKVRR